jgi:hypothetical protein
MDGLLIEVEGSQLALRPHLTTNSENVVKDGQKAAAAIIAVIA